MGYFNYFIKCIIRNISYKLCKPKVFLTILISVCILFGFKHYGFCAWTDGEIESCLDGLSTITNNQGVLISQLSSIGVDVTDLENSLSQIQSSLSAIQGNQATISTQIHDVLTKIDTLNTTLTRMAEEQNLFFQDMSSEIRTIRDALVGSDDTPFSAENLGVVTATHAGGSTPGLRKYKIPMIKNYTYKIQITYTNNTSSAISVSYLLSSYNVSSGGTISDARLSSLGVVPANSTVTLTVTTRDYTKPYLYLSYGYNVTSVSGTCSIEGLVDILDRTNQDVVNNIQQGNQLQQEQNQLQQEQNDFLKQETTDTDVSVDSFNNIDSNDITSNGLTGIFTTIYNSISSWNSKNIVFPISFAGTSMTIPGNLTENFILSIGGQPILTIIHTVYYFIVARFIIYSITSIINSIKSGSILNTDTKNNITTEML